MPRITEELNGVLLKGESGEHLMQTTLPCGDSVPLLFRSHVPKHVRDQLYREGMTARSCRVIVTVEEK